MKGALTPMLFTFVAMFLVLCVAGAVAVYVAYPHRGQDVPHAPWLGDAMKKGVDALPTLPAEEAEQRHTVLRH